MTDIAAYFSLFATAFIAATIFPAQSEAVLAGLITTERYSLALLVGSATAGNVLGSIVNWLLGRGIESFRNHRWFPLKPAQLDKAQGWYQRYGKWSLLFSWAPFVGDALTIAAGMLRERFWIFLVLVTIAKAGRYIVVSALVLRWTASN